MIHVVARMELNPGCREKMIAEIEKIVALVRAEDGCITYNPCLDINPAAGAEFITIVEAWESEAHLQAHLASAHMAAYKEAVKDLRKGSIVQVLNPFC